MLNFLLFLLIILLVIFILFLNSSHSKGAKTTKIRSPIPIIDRKVHVFCRNSTKDSLSSPKLFKYTTAKQRNVKSIDDHIPASHVSGECPQSQRDWFFNPNYHKDILGQQKYIMIGSASDEPKGLKYRIADKQSHQKNH